MINEVRYYCYDCADDPEVKGDDHIFTSFAAAVVHIIAHPMHFVDLEITEHIEED